MSEKRFLDKEARRRRRERIRPLDWLGRKTLSFYANFLIFAYVIAFIIVITIFIGTLLSLIRWYLNININIPLFYISNPTELQLHLINYLSLMLLFVIVYIISNTIFDLAMGKKARETLASIIGGLDQPFIGIIVSTLLVAFLQQILIITLNGTEETKRLLDISISITIVIIASALYLLVAGRIVRKTNISS